MSRSKRRQAYGRGVWAEWYAIIALMLKGYWPLERRYRTKLGEIDLVMKCKDLILFVEVKARPSLAEAMEAVSYEQQRRIENAADLWRARQSNGATLSMRFDLVAVIPWRWPVHVPHIFEGRAG